MLNLCVLDIWDLDYGRTWIQQLQRKSRKWSLLHLLQKLSQFGKIDINGSIIVIIVIILLLL